MPNAATARQTRSPAYAPPRQAWRAGALVLAGGLQILAAWLLLDDARLLMPPVATPALTVWLAPAAPATRPAQLVEPVHAKPATPARHKHPSSPMQAVGPPQAQGPAIPLVQPPEPTLDPEALRESLRQSLRAQAKQAPHVPAYALPDLSAPPSKLARDIDAYTARDDCKTAYADSGLLAVIPLVIDTVRNKGCKW